MSAEIIPFVPRTRSRQLDETPTSFRSAQRDDLVMDHADTAPCEILPSWTPSEGEAG